MNILIDAFGGDDAPLEVIKGGALAVQQLGVTVTLVGDEVKIRACAEKNGLSLDGMEILHAPAVFDIHEEPTTLLKQHRDTSMAVGMEALHNGRGDAFVCAGSTGALLVGSTFLVKRIPGIKRAAVAPVLPTETTPFLLIDGGVEHTRVAEEVLQTLGLDIPAYGMVKDDKHRTRALVTAEGAEIAISAVPSVFALIGTIQEETHRFAITYQRALRSRRMKKSGLEDIPGIGEKRRQALLKKFRSVKAISQAERSQLEQVLPASAALAVYQHFHPKEGGQTPCASSQEPPEASR